MAAVGGIRGKKGKAKGGKKGKGKKLKIKPFKGLANIFYCIVV